MTHNVHNHGNAHAHGDEAQLVELLELDGELIGHYLDEATAWVETYAPAAPRAVIDIGAGTGSGSIALARRFDRADIVAVDNSATLLDRLRAAVGERQLTHRVRGVQADLDEGWPDIGAVDVVWAASSLHHITDPDRMLRDAYRALNPGGVLVVTEIDGLQGFLPDDVGRGRPGLERRCHEALAQQGWNAYPDWGPHLERAGFSIAGRHTFTVTATSANIARYAHAYLSRI
ncbi:MAG: class I SAM-dependent methyltransferase, partial [Actinomycetia bacterium]|nr:class I SAM-dependent methyltransferase [Actinomycetes bacterium]